MTCLNAIEICFVTKPYTYRGLKNENITGNANYYANHNL